MVTTNKLVDFFFEKEKRININHYKKNHQTTNEKSMTERKELQKSPNTIFKMTIVNPLLIIIRFQCK